jgi:hypothetical protein
MTDEHDAVLIDQRREFLTQPKLFSDSRSSESSPLMSRMLAAKPPVFGSNRACCRVRGGSATRHTRTPTHSTHSRPALQRRHKH